MIIGGELCSSQSRNSLFCDTLNFSGEVKDNEIIFYKWQDAQCHLLADNNRNFKEKSLSFVVFVNVQFMFV